MSERKDLLFKIYRIYKIVIFFPPLLLLLWEVRGLFNALIYPILAYSFWFTLGFCVAGYLFLTAIKEEKYFNN
jgi:hypothetical protein